MTTNNEERKLWKILSNVQTNRRKMLEGRIKELKKALEEERTKEIWVCPFVNKVNK